MKFNENYIFLPDDIKYKDKDVVATIQIVDGKYEGVKFHFGEVFVDEKPEDDACFLRFNYAILSDHKELNGDSSFESTLEQIMNDVLNNALNMAEEKYKNELRAENT